MSSLESCVGLAIYLYIVEMEMSEYLRWLLRKGKVVASSFKGGCIRGSLKFLIFTSTVRSTINLELNGDVPTNKSCNSELTRISISAPCWTKIKDAGKQQLTKDEDIDRSFAATHQLEQNHWCSPNVQFFHYGWLVMTSMASCHFVPASWAGTRGNCRCFMIGLSDVDTYFSRSWTKRDQSHWWLKCST